MICAHKWHLVDTWIEEDGACWADYECDICGAERMIAQWDSPKEKYKIYYEE